ncbi:short-chain fatty acids transporter [Scopulibacillus darangshiensis]|uniref:Short-chain fatty acids transporter n=1 Tax=Scopulibacillus darangshiensis TaxID=442528 RepID=A0A4R2P9X0_9BACL|nr:short-chain fatty acid transporter [Scopulibacillus darangshiensis]TCP31742.1 short-chain fatty acids transporter [Scopulibacillus darangshiensis]
MLKKITAASNKLMERYLPDPFLFVILLTFVVFIFGIIITGSSPVKMVSYWGGGFWGLLAFSMQMVLILVTGYVLAKSPLFQTLLKKMAGKVNKPGTAIIVVTLVSLLASWINWGFGLVIGALFSIELAKKVKNVDYRLLIASAYSGFLVWHGGLSGSIPLTIATPGHFAEKMIGVIPTSQTIFSSFNLAIVIALFIVIPIINRLMLQKDHGYAIDPKLLEETETAAVLDQADANTPAEKLENSVWLSMIIGLLGIAFVIYYFVNGSTLNIDVVNFAFLFVGIILHKTPKRYLAAVKEAVTGAGGIILQFPFYAGIMGMMVDSGLAAQLSEWFVHISNAFTFPLFTFISAGIVNFFVPSGGGQWAVQAPVMLEATKALGVDPAKTAMAVAWGDAWTNMVQPFWALPALAIAGLKAKDIMGFCLIVLVVGGVIIGAGLLLL